LPVRIEYKESVERDLRKIDRKEANRILNKIEDVFSVDSDAGIALTGEYKGLFKLRVGDYRVIFAKTKTGVLILRIRHRKHVY
jgi:mRNA interferase RelE/StbE